MSTTTATDTITITTRRGITSDVVVIGAPDAPPVLALHGAGGHIAGEPALARLGERYRVYAPVWPGYGEAGGEELLDDMLDFALHGADVIDALGIGPGHGGVPPHLVGHSMGGMIAAEMAALAPALYGRIALIAPAGLWLEDHPIPDIFSMMPFDFPQYLFHDPAWGAALLTGGVDFNDLEAIKQFLILNSRRLGTAGKILFPVPNRRLSKRLYRLTNPVLLVWGESDRLISPAYARAWRELLASSQLSVIEEAGHMAPYEKPDQVAEAIGAFFAGD